MNSYELFLLSEETFKRNLKREEEMIKKIQEANKIKKEYRENYNRLKKEVQEIRKRKKEQEEKHIYFSSDEEFLKSNHSLIF